MYCITFGVLVTQYIQHCRNGRDLEQDHTCAMQGVFTTSYMYIMLHLLPRVNAQQGVKQSVLSICPSVCPSPPKSPNLEI
jgi:hypothetical protein